MAELNFPNSPVNNDTYSANGQSYIYDATVGAWRIDALLTLGTNTDGNYVAVGATSGNGLSGSTNSEGATFTVTSNATDANTASTIVFRDGSGNFSAGTITATLSGTATNATNATNAAITANDATNETVYPTFADAQTGNRPLETDVGLTYNPSTGVLSTTEISANTISPTTGTVITFGTTGDSLSMIDNEIDRTKFKDYSETVNNIGSTGGGTQDIDLTLGNVVLATVDTSANTFTFSNPPATGTAGSFTLILTNGGSQTVTWPATVDWAGGTAPTLTVSGVDVLTFLTTNAGTTWYGFSAGLDMK